MAGDFFSGIYDDLRGTFDDITGFFDSGVERTLDDGTKIISEVGEERLLESGFEPGSEAGTVFNQVGSKAVQTLLGGGGSSGGDKAASSQLSLREGFVSLQTGEARPTRTTGQPSVDMQGIERDWIIRMGKYANIEGFIDK